MAQGLQVVPSRLLLAQVGVDAHVPRGAGQAFVLPVWNVFVGVGVDVLLGQAEVDDVDDFVLLGRGATDQEVLRLDVSVDQMLGVDVLHQVK